MTNSQFSEAIALMCVLAVVAGPCGCQSSEAPDTASARTPVTGFLSDYSRLESVDNSTLRYIDRDNRLHFYTKFIVEPVVVHWHADQPPPDVPASQMERLTQYAHQAIVRAVEHRYLVVSESGRGVGRVRVALTDLAPPSDGVFPRGLISMEAEVVDSVTGRQIAAVVQTQTGQPRGVGSMANVAAAARRTARRTTRRVVRRRGLLNWAQPVRAYRRL
jgi:hypothetical protein